MQRLGGFFCSSYPCLHISSHYDHSKMSICACADLCGYILVLQRARQIYSCKMTQAEIKLSSLLLSEHFGEIVEKIGTHLIRMGSQPLRMIAHDTGMSLDQVCVVVDGTDAEERLLHE